MDTALPPVPARDPASAGASDPASAGASDPASASASDPASASASDPASDGASDPVPAPPARPRHWTALGPRDAPAIVFIHGTRLSRAQWLPQLRRLSGRYRCIAVDLPGHGTRHAQAWTIEAARTAVTEAITAEVPSGRAVLVGLSLGGFTAIEVADHDPDRVAGLVLAGCSGEAFGAMAWPFLGLAWILERVPRAVLQALNVAFFRLRYRRSVAEPIVEGGFWSLGGARAARSLVGRHFLDRLGRFWMPVLIINGALDPVFGPGGEPWAASCRRGRHAVLPWAMHLSNLDRPRAFSDLVGAFTDEAFQGS